MRLANEQTVAKDFKFIVASSDFTEGIFRIRRERAAASGGHRTNGIGRRSGNGRRQLQ
jgi:hypothetical protein